MTCFDTIDAGMSWEELRDHLASVHSIPANDYPKIEPEIRGKSVLQSSWRLTFSNTTGQVFVRKWLTAIPRTA